MAQYFCAILLIISSIVLAFMQVLDIGDVAGGTLMYIAQAFLLYIRTRLLRKTHQL